MVKSIQIVNGKGLPSLILQANDSNYILYITFKILLPRPDSPKILYKYKK